jgi:ATP-binding cassette, subfamily B, bacterial
MSPGAFRGMHSMRQSREVLQHKVKKGTIPRVLAFARPYRARLVAFLSLVVFDAVVASVNPLLLRSIIDKGIVHRHQGLIIGLSLGVAGLAVVDAVISILQRRYSSTIGESLIFDLRARVFRHVQAMPIAFFARTQTGALISRLNNDVIGAQQAFTDLFSNVIGNIITVVIVLSTMLWLSWQITLVSLFLLPAFLIPARYVGRRLGGLFKRSLELNAEMNSAMSERFNVAGAMIVKLFGRPEAEVAYFEERAGKVRDIGIEQAIYSRVFLVALSLTASLATAFAYGFGGIAAVNHVLTVGTVVALTGYLTRLYTPLTQLSNVQLDVMTALVSFERLFEVLDLEPMLAEADHAARIPSGPVTLTFDHVTFSYPAAKDVSLASLESVARLESHDAVDVLHDVSFTVLPGSMTALVGPSGAGKSTMSNLVPRLYDVTAGRVLLNGMDVRDATFQSLGDTVGVVAQDPHLFHDTIRANLLYARPEATEDDLRQALRSAQILDLVDSLPRGLDTVVGERGYRLSGGEKQRVALARLLLKGPQVVVLDEATAHLDSESEAAVQRALDETLAERTALVIAHRLSTIRGANQILVIDQGRIVQRGTHESLMSEGGLYRVLYETQFADQERVDGR